MPDPNRRNESSRRAILEATRALLAETGYADLTIGAIAARAGAGKQTIYRWWGGKSAVVLEALADSVAEAGTALPDTGDLRADLRAVLRATVAEFADPRLSATTRALMIETMGDDALAGQVRDRLLRPQLDGVKDRLRAGGVPPAIDLDLVVELLFGPLYHRWLLRTGPLDDGYADDLVDLVMAAIGERASG
ncbi:TetR-like C-terminal domain-containing protein [Catenuloplanes indicus]|uniref:AcrR family transcriptional regulator n=1 Tax=Catenuloplanes indicus TaxID=137267 RepID=A0AAE4AZH0_9ACTN|nr:TetR-like C-terminal domain-containing protein [Catenuloplanes indicus]MDQ0369120.1 AcrR family transcriptional regulator [Catenuloplanes indicus]